jgi:hypothetical protein
MTDKASERPSPEELRALCDKFEKLIHPITCRCNGACYDEQDYEVFKFMQQNGPTLIAAVREMIEQVTARTHVA